MATYLGEICLFSQEAPPTREWIPCDGKLLSIGNNPLLYSLLQTNFGGDGRTTFGVPDLRGAVVVGADLATTTTEYKLAARGGAETVQLVTAEMGQHGHTLPVSSGQSGKTETPSPETVLGPAGQRGALVDCYAAPEVQAANGVTMMSHGCGYAGGDKAHNNMAPYVSLSYFIAIRGYNPVRP